MNEPMIRIDVEVRRFAAAAARGAPKTAPAPPLSAPVAPQLLPARG